MTTAAMTPSYTAVHDQRFFTRLAIGMAAIIVFSFAQWALRGFVSPATAPVWVHLHGVAMLSWLGLLVAQGVLAGTGNAALHRTLGWLGVALVLCIAVIGPSATLQTGPASPAAQHLREAARSLSQRLGAPVGPV